QTLPEYLKENGIVAISDVDTRKLTRILRDGGAQGACILVGDDAQRAVQLAREFTGLSGQDLASQVSTKTVQQWTEGSWQLGSGFSQPDVSKYHVVAYDFGVKTNILRMLADRGCRISLVPAQTPAADVLAMQPDGV